MVANVTWWSTTGPNAKLLTNTTLQQQIGKLKNLLL